MPILQRHTRTFLPDDFQLSDWESVKPYFDELKQRSIHSADELHQWFADRSELEAYLSENFAWRYIRMTCNTADAQLMENLNQFITEIQPNVAPESDLLNRKAADNEYVTEIAEPGFPILMRNLTKDIELFREENIPLQVELQSEERKFGTINGAMTVTIDGKELTLPQASDYLLVTDRVVRENAYRQIQDRRLQDKDTLDELFSQLIGLRHQVAANAGFANFRDYMFKALGRFDYTPQDCFDFHASVAEAVVPLLNSMAEKRKTSLQLNELRPWDTKVDTENRPPLKPFANGDDLLDKTIDCFTRLDPFLGQCLQTMKDMNQLDLVSRKNKAPGGYNYPLDETGVPFIFMNATSNLRDLVTLLHEGGHAVHSLVTRDLPLNAYKQVPSEVAELASMSMELISMDHWDVFFPDEAELKRAKRQHLEGILETLPWVATIDKFQHWVYENPEHSLAQRQENWVRIYTQFTDSVTDWSGLEHYRGYLWQKQLHLFEVPLYYIEYGIAQLGAIAIWRNFKQDKKRGLDGYLNALKLGYTKPIREIYAAANISFDFSKDYIAELMQFLEEELKKL